MEMLRQVILCKQKKWRWTISDPHLAKQFTNMQGLENNNWIILDALGNIYEIYANLSVLNFLNHNHF